MKVVLGYSGGLDTSIIVPWLKENYQAEVICMAANVGRNDDLTQLEAKAKKTGASALVVQDLRKEFVEEFAWPTLRASCTAEPISSPVASWPRIVLHPGPCGSPPANLLRAMCCPRYWHKCA